MTHLWLGESGISNFDAFGVGQSDYQEREVFCTKVAAEFLVPGRFAAQVTGSRRFVSGGRIV